MLREPLKDRAVGRWPAILPALGVSAKMLSNRHGPCPMCGGKDRFRFDNKGGRGTWICSKCGAGDGIELVKRLKGCDFKEAARLIEQHIGDAPVMSRSGQPKDDGQKREEMAALWKRSRPITPEDPAGLYMRERTGLTKFPSSCLRFSPDERYTEAGKRPSWHPAMIAAVMPCDAALADGETAALHRTYLTADGRKAQVSSPRKMMGTMPTGAAVRLMQYDDVLGIAEGIETAFSAWSLHNVPTWAALNAGLLERWIPPTGLRAVFIFGDNDTSHTGQAAAHALAQRLKAKGLDVILELPPCVGRDWNDIHMEKRRLALPAYGGRGVAETKCQSRASHLLQL